MDVYESYITDRQRRNTLPNIKRKHRHRRSIVPYVKEDEGHTILGCLAILIMWSSLMKRLIKIPFIIPVKIMCWIYGMLKDLLQGIVWLLQYICPSFCCDKITVTEHLTQLKDIRAKMDAIEEEKIDVLSELKEMKQMLEKSERENYKAVTRLRDYEEHISVLKKEKENALSRLSELMGDKLRDKNPAITNLNDPNRPLKIGEQYSEVYENEWTDAYSTMLDQESLTLTEKEIVSILLDILREIYQCCLNDVAEQFSGCRKIVNGFSDDEISDYMRAVKDSVKVLAVKYIPLLCMKVTNDGSPCKSAVRYQDFSLPYIENCVKMCYFAVVQDPPMYLDFEPGGVFDRLAFKEFTKSGTRVDYLVWPALYLYKDGPLLSKGVVQAIGNV